MSRLIVGLGNPGKKYESTRHNIGQTVFEYLSFSSQLNWVNKFKGIYTSYNWEGEKIHFLMPQTYMNLSGESVQAVLNFYKILPENIIVVHDDVDLTFGQLVFKKGGGLAGHNGLKSIAGSIGCRDFMRIRLGIGRPVHGSVSSFVLSGYDKAEQMFLEDFLKGSAAAIEGYIRDGFDSAAKEFSRKNFVETGEGN